MEGKYQITRDRLFPHKLTLKMSVTEYSRLMGLLNLVENSVYPGDGTVPSIDDVNIEALSSRIKSVLMHPQKDSYKNIAAARRQLYKRYVVSYAAFSREWRAIVKAYTSQGAASKVIKTSQAPDIQILSVEEGVF